jgi:hypothetical protein
MNEGFQPKTKRAKPQAGASVSSPQTQVPAQSSYSGFGSGAQTSGAPAPAASGAPVQQPFSPSLGSQAPAAPGSVVQPSVSGQASVTPSSQSPAVGAYAVDTNVAKIPPVLEEGGFYGGVRRFSAFWFPPLVWGESWISSDYRTRLRRALNTGDPSEFRSHVENAADMLKRAGLYNNSYPSEVVDDPKLGAISAPSPFELEWAIDRAHAMEQQQSQFTRDQIISQMKLLHQRIGDESSKSIGRWWKLRRLQEWQMAIAIVLFPISLTIFIIIWCLAAASSGSSK